MRQKWTCLSPKAQHRQVSRYSIYMCLNIPKVEVLYCVVKSIDFKVHVINETFSEILAVFEDTNCSQQSVRAKCCFILGFCC